METTSYYLNDDVTSKKGISGVTITIPNEVSFPMTVKIEINR
ncbi:hypothetical protein FACS1894190_17710 [Spirochaetia bacterium]|nr:hypothetical protein FACS1894190_17710 [Spirochaetia bacterium]